MTNPVQQVAAFFDRRARDFDAIYTGDRPLHHRLWDRLTRRNLFDRMAFALRELAPLSGATVLDVGCGSGRYGVALAAGGAAQVVGIDASPAMLRLAEEIARGEGVGDRCVFVQTDVRAYAPGRSFTGVVAMGFFDYVADAAAMLAHLRPLTGRRLVASFPARWAVRAPLRRLWLGARGCPVYFYDARQVRDWAVRAGFTDVRVVRRGPILLLSAVPG